MMKTLGYLKNSEISMRFGLNPFNWVWIPSAAYEPPSAFYPKRKTFALVWLGVALYLDWDDGTFNSGKLGELMMNHPAMLEVKEDGSWLEQVEERG